MLLLRFSMVAGYQIIGNEVIADKNATFAPCGGTNNECRARKQSRPIYFFTLTHKCQYAPLPHMLCRPPFVARALARSGHS